VLWLCKSRAARNLRAWRTSNGLDRADHSILRACGSPPALPLSAPLNALFSRLFSIPTPVCTRHLHAANNSLKNSHRLLFRTLFCTAGSATTSGPCKHTIPLSPLPPCPGTSYQNPRGPPPVPPISRATQRLRCFFFCCCCCCYYCMLADHAKHHSLSTSVIQLIVQSRGVSFLFLCSGQWLGLFCLGEHKSSFTRKNNIALHSPARRRGTASIERAGSAWEPWRVGCGILALRCFASRVAAASFGTCLCWPLHYFNTNAPSPFQHQHASATLQHPAQNNYPSS
jgi:hypothetical protein